MIGDGFLYFKPNNVGFAYLNLSLFPPKGIEPDPNLSPSMAVVSPQRWRLVEKANGVWRLGLIVDVENGVWGKEKGREEKGEGEIEKREEKENGVQKCGIDF